MKYHVPRNGEWEPGSRPARGAWIEIMYDGMSCGHIAVAPREGRVD